MDECLFICASYCGLFGQCALSSVRLDLIKRLDVVKHGVFNWDLSVPVLTSMGLPALTPMSSRFIWLFVYLFWGVLHFSLFFSLFMHPSLIFHSGSNTKLLRCADTVKIRVNALMTLMTWTPAWSSAHNVLHCTAATNI